MIAFRRVVVDDIEDHLDPRRVEGLHHLLELADLLAARAAARVLVVRREKADGVVAPVIAQASIEQMPIVHELVDRHQFDGADAKPLKIADGRRMGEARIGAAKLGRDLPHQRGEALHMKLVDLGLVQRSARPSVVTPIEAVVDDDRAGHIGRAVVRIRFVLVPCAVGIEAVGEDGGVPRDRAFDRARVRIEQELGRIAAIAARRLPRSMNAIAVALPGHDAGHVAVPAEGAGLRKIQSPLVPGLVEQAQLHTRRDLREDGEVDAAAIERGAQRVPACPARSRSRRW